LLVVVVDVAHDQGPHLVLLGDLKGDHLVHPNADRRNRHRHLNEGHRNHHWWVGRRADCLAHRNEARSGALQEPAACAAHRVEVELASPWRSLEVGEVEEEWACPSRSWEDEEGQVDVAQDRLQEDEVALMNAQLPRFQDSLQVLQE